MYHSVLTVINLRFCFHNPSESKIHTHTHTQFPAKICICIHYTLYFTYLRKHYTRVTTSRYNSTTQPSAPVPVRMEELALYLTLARVMWGGLECNVKQVSLCAKLKLICSLICSSKN